MNMNVSHIVPTGFTIFVLAMTAQADVVINEIFYNAPADLERLEFVELHNTSGQPVALSGWQFSKGVEFKFPEGSRIDAGGYLVLCRDQELFKEFYPGVEAYAVYEKSLDNGGETLTLKNADGKKVDSVKYDDEGPWAKSADGYSASLERICPMVSGKNASNWAPSILSDDYDRKASGTPGKQNSTYTATLPPVIETVTFSPEAGNPNETITVNATVADADATVELCYRVAAPGKEGDESVLPMKRLQGDHHVAMIPGTDANRLIRFRVKATDKHGASRYFPHQNALRPALSVYVSGETALGKIPVAHFFNVGEDEWLW